MNARAPEELLSIPTEGRKFVYVLSSASGLLKIGSATSPAVRCKLMESSSGFETVVAAQFGPYRGAHLVERAAQAALSTARRKGEWFSCSVAEAESAISYALENFREPACSPSGDLELGRSIASKFAADMFDIGGADEDHKALLVVLEASVASHSKAVDDLGDALELVDFYRDSTVDLMSTTRGLLSRIKQLEKELADLKDKVQPKLV